MFGIQDPTYQDAVYLQNLLRSGCRGATAGGGAYAFASKGGIRMTLGDKSFKKFLETGRYTMIIGMDDITDTAALDEMAKMMEQYKGHLSVKAYIHGDDGSTFHPKFSWFQTENGGVLILGSGNLTQTGMNLNREAYSVVPCDKEEISRIRREWKNWYDHSKPFLFDVNDPIVRTKARWNEEKLRATSAAKLEFEKAASNRPEILRLKEIYRKQPKNLIFQGKSRPSAENAEIRAFSGGHKATTRRTALRAMMKKHVLRTTARLRRKRK